MESLFFQNYQIDPFLLISWSHTQWDIKPWHQSFQAIMTIFLKKHLGLFVQCTSSFFESWVSVFFYSPPHSCVALSWLPLPSVSVQRKQSLAEINPIESDSFHQPRINTFCFMSLCKVHTGMFLHRHGPTQSTLPLIVGKPFARFGDYESWPTPLKNDLSAYRLTCSPGDTKVHFDSFGSAKDLLWHSYAKQYLHYTFCRSPMRLFLIKKQAKSNILHNPASLGKCEMCV